jgi:hypothetical protein
VHERAQLRPFLSEAAAMDQRDMEDRVKNLNDRVQRIEQILPTLATKADLAAVIAPLATRDELHAAIKEEGVRTRQHFDVVAERLEGHIKPIAEGHVAVNDKVDALGVDMRTADAALDRRVTRLEAKR